MLSPKARVARNVGLQHCVITTYVCGPSASESQEGLWKHPPRFWLWDLACPTGSLRCWCCWSRNHTERPGNSQTPSTFICAAQLLELGAERQKDTPFTDFTGVTVCGHANLNGTHWKCLYSDSPHLNVSLGSYWGGGGVILTCVRMYVFAIDLAECPGFQNVHQILGGTL